MITPDPACHQRGERRDREEDGELQVDHLACPRHRLVRKEGRSSAARRWDDGELGIGCHREPAVQHLDGPFMPSRNVRPSTIAMVTGYQDQDRRITSWTPTRRWPTTPPKGPHPEADRISQPLLPHDLATSGFIVRIDETGVGVRSTSDDVALSVASVDDVPSSAAMKAVRTEATFHRVVTGSANL
jgi:hypothetical protein